jgi:amino acid transporter
VHTEYDITTMTAHHINGTDNSRQRFGTFAGVFTPTVLTILGLILFLRIGWVVGQAGLAGALLIIAVSNLITLLTTLSLSAVATSRTTKAGGLYYMISRTLGLEIGGAIGIPLFLSQAVSVAFYIIGFTESLRWFYPELNPQLISTGVAVVFGMLAFVGADFVLKIQYVVLGLLAAAVISFFAGGWGQEISPTWLADENATVSFRTVFAIFFPAVTGITVGVSMSGDLRNAAKSIPLGTLSAIGLTAAIYFGVAVWLALHVSPAELISNDMIMSDMAFRSEPIIIGVWASTLSSALGSIIAAPRVLEALAVDSATPKFFAGRLGSATEPRVAVLITAGIAVAVIWMGDLDFVAPVITMFFLNTYGMINLSACIELLVGSPSFRPQLRVPWYVSFAGACGCYGAMLLIHWPATVVALIVSYGIFVLLKRRAVKQEWGDVRRGIWFELTKLGLIQLENNEWHPRNWRPNVIIFSGLLKKREQLLELGAWIGGGRGLVTYFHLLPGNIDELTGGDFRGTSRRYLRKVVSEKGLTAFTGSAIVKDFFDGVLTVIQAHGITGAEPNAAVMGWSAYPEVQVEQLKLMKRLVALKKSVVFLDYKPEPGYGKKSRIDVWWRGKDKNGELMLLLAYIISQSDDWQGCKIRVLRMIEHEEGRAKAEEHFEQLFQKAHIRAEAHVLVRSSPDQKFGDLLWKTGRDADLVMAGLPIVPDDQIEKAAKFISDNLPYTVTALLVRNNETEDILQTD